MLHILTRDLGSFLQLYDASLSTLPSIMRLTSTLVMKSIVQNWSTRFERKRLVLFLLAYADELR